MVLVAIREVNQILHNSVDTAIDKNIHLVGLYEPDEVLTHAS